MFLIVTPQKIGLTYFLVTSLHAVERYLMNLGNCDRISDKLLIFLDLRCFWKQKGTSFHPIYKNRNRRIRFLTLVNPAHQSCPPLLLSKILDLRYQTNQSRSLLIIMKLHAPQAMADKIISVLSTTFCSRYYVVECESDVYDRSKHTPATRPICFVGIVF